MNLPDVKIVTVDTETSGLHWDDGARTSTVIIGWELHDGTEDVRIQMLPFDQGRLDEKMPMHQRELDLWGRSEEKENENENGKGNLGHEEWNELLRWLSGREMLIMHHAKFDLHMLRVGTREWEGLDLLGGGWDGIGPLIWCTQVAARELDPLEPLGLDAVAERYGLGKKESTAGFSEWLAARKLDKGRYDLVPIELMRKYATRDVELTQRVWKIQKERANREGLLEQIGRKFDLTDVLYKMEMRGIPYDVEKSLEIADQLEKEIARLEKERPFGDGLAAARKWFFDTQGGTYLRVTDKGTKSVDEETTRSLEKEGIEWATEYRQLQTLKTAVSMWYRGYAEKVGPDGRLRCTYRQTKVVSNRMSVERVQLQAIPKQNKVVLELLGPGTSVRSCIRSGPRKSKNGAGNGSDGGRTGKLWNLDLQQAELRVAAKYAQCEKMLRMLEEGVDFHSETTKRVLGVTEKDADWKIKRDTGKQLTFSSIFQIGGPAFQELLAKKGDIHLSVGECEQMVWKWRAEYPEFGRAYQKAEQKADSRGWVRLLPGTKYESESWFGKWEDKGPAWSRIVQGSLAEALALWLVASEKEVGGRMILTVHDSVLVEGSKRDAEKIAKIGELLLTRLFDTEMKVEVAEWSY